MKRPIDYVVQSDRSPVPQHKKSNKENHLKWGLPTPLDDQKLYVTYDDL